MKKVSLSEKELKSKRGKSSRVKGATYENKIAKIIKDIYNITLKRTPSSGGFAKEQHNEFFCGDLTCVDKGINFLLHIEAKNQKVLKLKDWLEQARSDCVRGKIPVVIFHTSKQVHGKAEDYITLPLSEFLNLVPVEKLVKRR